MQQTNRILDYYKYIHTYYYILIIATIILIFPILLLSLSYTHLRLNTAPLIINIYLYTQILFLSPYRSYTHVIVVSCIYNIIDMINLDIYTVYNLCINVILKYYTTVYISICISIYKYMSQTSMGSILTTYPTTLCWLTCRPVRYWSYSSHGVDMMCMECIYAYRCIHV